MLHDQTFQALQNALNALQEKRIDSTAFCTIWRSQSSLLATLPARYAQVLDDLLSRLETSSLFNEESCSFSPEDLHSNLATWLSKAQQTIATTN
jgi:hypothetical protein